MIRNKDWADRLAERLAEVEVAPPTDGWQRLEGALSQAKRGAMWFGWRSAGMAAALVVAVCGVAWYFIPVGQVDENRGFDEAVLSFSNEPLSSVEQSAVAMSHESLEVNYTKRVNAIQSEKNKRSPKVEDEVAQGTENPSSEAVAHTPSSDADDVVAEEAAPTPSKPNEQAATMTGPREERLIAQHRVLRPAKRGWQLGIVGGSGAGLSAGAAGADGMFGNHFMQDATGHPGVDSLPRPLPEAPKQMQRAVWPANYATADIEHDRPWSVGVTVARELGRGFSLETGLQYTLLRSTVHYPYATEQQSLHLLGVPLRLHKELLDAGRFGIYVGAGGVVELPLYGKVGDKMVRDRRLQLSLSVVAGARYRLGELVELYFEPDLGYQFTETRLRTIRTEHPLNLSLRAGLRFRLRGEK